MLGTYKLLYIGVNNLGSMLPLMGAKEQSVMGKTDKGQPRLTFKKRKTTGTREEDMPSLPASQAVNYTDTGEDIRYILAAMQQSLSSVDSKIDSLSFRMDRMSERMDKHAERLDMAERRISETEDAQTALESAQKQMKKSLVVLRDMMEDLEARSLCNNI